MTPSAPGVAAVLLTGGSSRRMGRDKATIAVGDSTLAQRLADVLTRVVESALEVGPGVTSLPGASEEPPGEGPLAALVAGARALSRAGHAGPVLCVACDLPFLTEPTLSRLAAWPAAGSVVPVVAGRTQPLCARWSVADLAHAAELVERGERSFRPLLEGPGVVLVAEAQWGDLTAMGEFADVDTPEDLARLGLAT